ncbi:hypothetical protein [Marinoscillum sp. MHG1-6]|uniref:CBU_0592 family membrane protein n=1 Tax=Marinoscillum sp. MHG1-6 TaxID=2959627 RepID=UPI00215881A1|nr:hypothetical protein [Marinoscillum sp. MHG1-6]
MELWIDILGWIGSIEVVLAYYLISQKYLDASSIWYQFLNLTGALLLIANTYYYKSYPSSFINVIWVGIAGYALIKIWRS